MNEEHVSERLLAGYVDGDEGLTGDESWAVEAHLESCAECRGRLAAISTPSVAALVDDVWSGLEPRLAETQPVRHRRAARVNTWVTPVMVSWLATMLLLPALGLLLDKVAFAGADGFSFVLLFAPVLPVLGVAALWSKGLDPAYELVRSAPRGGFYLILRRTTALLAVVLPVQVLAGWLGGSGPVLGLLPSLAFTGGTLALGTLIGVTRAAFVLAGFWVAVIAVPTVASAGRITLLAPEMLPMWGGVFAVTVAVVVFRRGTFGLLSGYER